MNFSNIFGSEDLYFWKISLIIIVKKFMITGNLQDVDSKLFLESQNFIKSD